MGAIDLYKAIDEMRRISISGGTFSFAFRKYNRDTLNGGDLVRIPQARVRPKAKDSKIKNSSYKLFFTDVNTGEPLNCWECLIVEFNGMKTILS